MAFSALADKLSHALSNMSKSFVIDQKVVNQLVNDICLALCQADVDVRLVKTIRENIQKKIDLEQIAKGHNKRKLIQRVVVEELCHLLEPTKNQPFVPLKKKENIVIFVGLQGAGKTTTCAKYGLFYKKKGFKVGLVCGDTFRAGAFDQLKQNAIKAKIDFFGKYTERDPAICIQEGIQKFRETKTELILIDTSGRHGQADELMEEWKEILSSVKPAATMLVMDSSIGQSARRQVEAFQGGVDGVIMTKLDGHSKGGGALSAVSVTQKPIVFLGTGEHLGDLEKFETRSFINRLLGFGDFSALVEKFGSIQPVSVSSNRDLVDPKDWNFQDMYEQIITFHQMGSVAQMIPGMKQTSEKEASEKLKRFMIIIDSMSKKEKLGDVKIFNIEPTRKLRLMTGSGSSEAEVDELFVMFRNLQKLADKLKKLSQTFKSKSTSKMMMANSDPLLSLVNQLNPMLSSNKKKKNHHLHRT